MSLWATLLVVMAVAGHACAGLVFLLAAAQKMRHWRLLPGVIGKPPPEDF